MIAIEPAFFKSNTCSHHYSYTIILPSSIWDTSTTLHNPEKKLSCFAFSGTVMIFVKSRLDFFFLEIALRFIHLKVSMSAWVRQY